MNRRQFLKSSGTALSLASLGGLSAALSSFDAHAADTDGYKALVCVFLLGGMDNHDTIIPYDTASHTRYAQIRSSLITAYNGSRSRTNLLPLAPDNAGNFGNRQFALPPELPGLHNLFQQGNAAIIGNVGPLLRPLSRTEFENESIATPARLFSHNDQQATWMSSSPEGAQYGWGGFFADKTLAANGQAPFSAITSGGNELFLTGINSTPYQIGVNGAQTLIALEDLDTEDAQHTRLLRNHFRAANFQGQHILEQDMANAMKASFDTNQAFKQSLAGAPPLNTTFPARGIGKRLQAIARTISIRDKLTAKRQVFIVGMGGFDTHDQQAADLPKLHTALDGAITSFYAALTEMGLANNVTLFTASDFGRTLAINGDGTDHGWGAHHFVVGGSVSGRQIYGDIPPANFNHPQDAGSGRLIPTTSVEQFAAPLGSWFGLNETELQASLPNLSNFVTRPGFI